MPELLLRVAGQQQAEQQQKEDERRRQEVGLQQQQKGMTTPAVDPEALSRNVWFQSWAQKQQQQQARQGPQQKGQQEQQQQGKGQDDKPQEQQQQHRHHKQQQQQQQQQLEQQQLRQQQQQQLQQQQQQQLQQQQQQQQQQKQQQQQLQKQQQQHLQQPQQQLEQQQHLQDQEEHEHEKSLDQQREDQPYINPDQVDKSLPDLEEDLAGDHRVENNGRREQMKEEQENKTPGDANTKQNRAQFWESDQKPAGKTAVLHHPLTVEAKNVGNAGNIARSRTYFPVGGEKSANVKIKDDIFLENVAASERFAPDDVALEKQSQQLPPALDYPLWRIAAVLSDEKPVAAAAASSVSASDDFYLDRDWRLLAPPSNTQHSVAQGTSEKNGALLRTRGTPEMAALVRTRGTPEKMAHCVNTWYTGNDALCGNVVHRK